MFLKGLSINKIVLVSLTLALYFITFNSCEREILKTKYYYSTDSIYIYGNDTIFVPSFDGITISLPDTLKLLKNKQYNVLFDNITNLPIDNSLFKVSMGIQYRSSFKLNISTSSIIRIDIRNPFNLEKLKSKLISLNVLQWKEINDSLGVMLLGDSHFADGKIGQKLKELNSKLFGIGQLGYNSFRHEGRGGATASWYNSKLSPFVKQSKFNFLNYIDSLNQKQPDYVILSLGTNDIFSAKKVDDIVDRFTNIKNMLTSIIESIKKVSKVYILTLNQGSSQDAFGSNYGSVQDYYTYRMNVHKFNKMLQTDSYLSKHLIICNLAIISPDDYQTNNALHLNESGKSKTAQAIYNMLVLDN